MTRGLKWGIWLVSIVTTTGAAQAGISIRAGTLGFGGDLSLRASSVVGLRLGGNYYSTTRNTTIDGIVYDMEPRLQSGTAILDLHPFGGALHLSGGVVRNANQGRVDARLAGPITIGDRTYSPEEVGSLTGRLQYRDFSPYAGIGFGGRGRISFLFDVGVVFAGYPRASLVATTTLTGEEKAAFDQNVQQEVEQIQSDIESRKYLKYYPVISLGLRVGL
jgi:hypothetical protein